MADLLPLHVRLNKSKKKIGVRFCGGCNPTYDRAEMIDRVQSHERDQMVFTRYDEEDLDALILVSGCFRTCAGQNFASGVRSYSIAQERDIDTLIDWLDALHPKIRYQTDPDHRST